MSWHAWRRLLALTMLLALQACATVAQPDARDPMESFNRTVFGFNEVVDKAVLKPVATGYKAVTPDWMRKGVRQGPIKVSIR